MTCVLIVRIGMWYSHVTRLHPPEAVITAYQIDLNDITH